MMSVLDFTLGMLTVYGPPEAHAQAGRVRRTLDWVERSCRDEGLPPWCTMQVRRNFEVAFTANPWAPTLPDEEG